MPRPNSGGSSGYSEIPLWVNSSPTANFAAQNVTLNGAISDYDYIKIVFQNTNNSSITGYDIQKSVLMSTSDFKVQYNYLVGGWVWGTLTQIRSHRFAEYVDDTTIKFYDCGGIGASGTGNSYLIPLKIYGIK